MERLLHLPTDPSVSDTRAALRLLEREPARSADTPRRPLRWVFIAGGLALGAILASGATYLLLVTRHNTSAAARGDFTGAAPSQLQSSPARNEAGDVLLASGYVVARRTAVVTPEITGRLSELLVEEGQTVKKGQLLAILNASIADRETAAATARAWSAAATARAAAADLASAKANLQRTEELARSGFVSPSHAAQERERVLNIAAQLDRADAEAVAARADQARSVATQDLYKIRAPIDGVVVETLSHLGELISPISAASPFGKGGICTIVDMSSLEAVIDVRETLMRRLAPGQTVQVRVDAFPDLKIASHVIAILPTVNRDRATVRVRLSLPQLPVHIVPGLEIKAEFKEGSQQ